MAKIANLLEKLNPTGDETVLILDDGVAKRSTMSKLLAGIRAAFDANAQAASAALGATADLIPAFSKLQTAAAPPARMETRFGRAVPVGGVSASVANWMMTDPSMLAKEECYCRQFSAFLANAQAGRTVEFYIARPSTGAILWRSGLMLAEAAGIFTTGIFPTSAGTLMQPGDCVGGYAAGTGANLFGYELRTFTTSRVDARRFAVGENFRTGETTGTQFQPMIAYMVSTTNLVLGNQWLNAPYGVARLDDKGRMAGSQSLGFAGRLLAVEDTQHAIEGTTRVFRSKTKFDRSDSYMQLPTGSAEAFPKVDWCVATYINGMPGASKSGFLTDVTLSAAAEIPANCTLQAWVVRPRTTPPMDINGSFVVDVVYQLGTWSLADLGAVTLANNVQLGPFWHPIQAGDLVVFRGPQGFGFKYGFGAGYGESQLAYLGGLTDMTLNALDPFNPAGYTFTNAGANRRALMSVHIVDGDFLSSGAGPVAAVRTDGQGNLPASAARPAALPLKGWKGCVTGSSISTPSGGGNPADIGHWPRAEAMLQCQIDNFANGGSYACWNVPGPTNAAAEPYTIFATAAEITARYGAGFAQYSYQRLILGRGYRFVVLPDWMNDSNDASLFPIGAYSASTDPTTFSPQTLYGAYQRAILEMQNDPTIERIYFQTPFHNWGTGTGTTAVDKPIRRQARAAMYDLNDKMNCSGVIDYIRDAGVDAVKVKNGKGLYDSIHPYIDRKIQAAQSAIYPVLNRG